MTPTDSRRRPARGRTMSGPSPRAEIDPVEMTSRQRRVLFMAASVLLDYPGEGFAEALELTRDQLDGLPGPVAAELCAFLDAAGAAGLRGSEVHYVETFDQRRRCSLYLSYYAVGDTRRRGAAILAFRQQLAALGFEQAREELPDHVCVVLEAAARTGQQRLADAVEVLAAHREGLEVLRHALENLGSHYAHLIRAVCMALPRLDAQTRARYLDLIRSGPPAELVGIGTPLPFPTREPEVAETRS